MKVTDEMLRVFVRELDEEAFHDASTDPEAMAVARPAFEAALADEPPPPWLPEELSKALLRAAVAEDKLAKLEAKLEKVRAWAAKHDQGLDGLPYDTAPDYGELEAILDGKEQP